MDSSDSDQENNNTTTGQSSQQRKLCYRELLNKVEDIQESEDLSLETVKEIGNIIKKVNVIELESDISERYQHPDETLLDSMVLSSASNILVKCIESVDVDTVSYIPADFADKIMKFVAPDEEFESDNLLMLLDDAHHIIPEVPEYSFVYGTYDLSILPQPKQKKSRQKQQQENFVKKQPEKVTNLENEEQGIDEIVKVFYDILVQCCDKNNEQPIKYYDYIIDTSSFSSTVENMFYCSFLVRDGKAHIDLDTKGVPYIKPVKKRELKRFREEGGSNSQVISTITISEWE
ncbi:EP300-interacting inhibitor of differentiation 3, partial [Asbolus verrucosus]